MSDMRKKELRVYIRCCIVFENKNVLLVRESCGILYTSNNAMEFIFTSQY